jgi:hypothetical protein
MLDSRKVLLLAGLFVALQGCDDRKAVKKEAQRRIEAAISHRDDIPLEDRQAAAAAIASDLVDVAIEGAAAQAQFDAENAALEAASGGVDGAISRECAQLELERDALLGIQSREGAGGEADAAEIQATIQRTELRLSELCEGR